jgi:hypothetical protein
MATGHFFRQVEACLPRIGADNGSGIGEVEKNVGLRGIGGPVRASFAIRISGFCKRDPITNHRCSHCVVGGICLVSEARLYCIEDVGNLGGVPRPVDMAALRPGYIRKAVLLGRLSRSRDLLHNKTHRLNQKPIGCDRHAYRLSVIGVVRIVGCVCA